MVPPTSNVAVPVRVQPDAQTAIGLPDPVLEKVILLLLPFRTICVCANAGTLSNTNVASTEIEHIIALFI